MSTTYAQRQTTAQKKDASSAASVLDSSSQSESLQRKADMANNAVQRAEAPQPNNTGMPDNLKAGIESLSGFSMDDVRVHYNSSKPATVQALAYTQGTDIHVAPGQEKHLPHEAWHVAQQMAGRVSPTTNINGMPVNDNAALEHEADVMGEKAVQCKEKKVENNLLNIGDSHGCVSQLMWLEISFIGGSDKIRIDKFGLLCELLCDTTIFYVKINQNEKKSRASVRETLEKMLGNTELELLRSEYADVPINDFDDLESVACKINECRLCDLKDSPIPQRSIDDIIRDDFIENENVFILEDSQIRHLSDYKEDCPIKTQYYDTLGFLYHVDGHSKILKPIWYLRDGKIVVLGLYQHPDGDWQQYNLKKGKGPKTINIIE